MTGGYVGSILSRLTADKTYDAFVRVGFVDADWVGIPVGVAEGWAACGGGDELLNTCCVCSFIPPIKIACVACVCFLNKLGVDECDGRCAMCPVQCHNLVPKIIICLISKKKIGISNAKLSPLCAAREKHFLILSIHNS